MKKAIYLLLVLAIVLGLAACGSSPQSSSSQEPEDSEEELIEIALETYFNGTKEGDDGETLGVHAFILWYSDRMDYQISEYVSDIDNVVYYQEGIAFYGEDVEDPMTIERTEDDPGSIEIILDGNDIFYKIVRESGEVDLVLSVLTEEEFAELS